MVTMFDAGLRSATTSGNYDRARTLANQKLEQAKGIPYDSLATEFPTGSMTTPPNGDEGTSACRTTSGGFAYRVTKQYVDVEPNGSDTFDLVSSDAADPSAGVSADVGLVKVVVTAYWPSGSCSASDKKYMTTGVVSS